jgi:hypothetical protein
MYIDTCLDMYLDRYLDKIMHSRDFYGKDAYMKPQPVPPIDLAGGGVGAAGGT